ncbi:baculoviral IAP repeat-containing protein 5-like [Neocloeon triangulifer]|uniref:baculoviral IAP repeat-containing protein 5-like n=1 Tax=Neocloeon triangulifer TaxID=2078957 RepID=UPI00286ED993|nr:baculoviral IAP repeat-containing protein 5-like [Neocloeon triangulifer]
MVKECGENMEIELNDEVTIEQPTIMMSAQRLETFGEKGMWFEVGSASRQDMVKSGFYCPSEDKRKNRIVKCTYCRKEFANWTRDDKPEERHLAESSECPFAQFGRDEEELTVREFLELELAVKLAVMDEDKEKLKAAAIESFSDVEKLLNKK